MNTPQPHPVAPAELPTSETTTVSVSVLDLLTWLGESKRLIAGITAFAIAASLALALTRTSIYTARTTLIPPSAQQPSGSAAALASLGSSIGMAGGGLGAKTPDEQYVSLLRSNTVQRALIDRFQLKKRYAVDKYEVLRKVLPGFIRVLSDKKSGVLTVEVDDEDPQFAADLANAHAEEVIKLLGKLAVTEAQQRRTFFEQQLKNTKENLIKAEQTLREVQEKSGMVVLDKQAEALIEMVAKIKVRIAEREVQLKVMRTGTTPDNPQVRLLSSEIAALRGELARMESSTGTEKPSKGRTQDIPVNKLPATAVDFIRATREVKFQESMLASMLRQFETAKMDETKDAPSLQQVDVALPPDYKSGPSRAGIVLAGTLIGLLGSSLFILARRYVDLVRRRDPHSVAAWGGLAKAWRWRR
jgi:tyrosine-protein kinase Etk/Wzc